MRRVLRLRGLHESAYCETALLVAKQVSPHFSDRKRGKKKDQNEIRFERRVNQHDRLSFRRGINGAARGAGCNR